MGSIQGGSEALGLPPFPPKQMIRLVVPVLMVGSLLIPIAPVSAAVLANGKVSNGYYWQKTATKSGSIRYNCRSTSSGKFQKHQKCKDAGAVKPN